jgi:hypothetical protein
MDAKKAASSAPRRTTVYLPENLLRQAKIYAAKHDTSVNQLVIAGLKAQLKAGSTVAGDAGD